MELVFKDDKSRDLTCGVGDISCDEIIDTARMLNCFPAYCDVCCATHVLGLESW